MTVFSERTRTLMNEKKLTQKELSTISGVSEPSLCRYLKGQEPRMDVVNNVAKALGVNADYLMGGGLYHTAEDPFVETRNIVTRNKGNLTDQQKTELLRILFDK